MARDTRKRWLARITLVALAGLIGLAVWLRWRTQPRLDKAPGPAVLHETGPLGPTDPDASLVVTESLHDKPEHRTRVVRYDFKNGRVQPPETLWEGSYQRFGSLGGLPPIVANRYLVAASGSVIDLQEKTLIHEGAGRLLEVRGDRVVSGVSNDWGKLERLAAFNFRTCVIDKLTDREAEEFRLRSELREERSPDGMKSVVASKNVLTLFHVGHPPKEWGIFKLGDYPTHSGLWIDNERFLTQDGNGNLLTVRLDGTRVPVMRVPLEAKTKSSPYFRRDTDGRIIYSCSGTQFFIDTEAKSWERCEWESRGHGFEESCDDQMRRIYRYKGTEIARSPFWTRMGPYEALTTESYIAVFVESDLLVWSAGTGKWTTLGTRTDQIAGWIK